MKILLQAFRSALTSLYPFLTKVYWGGYHSTNRYIESANQIPHQLFRSPESGKFIADLEKRRSEMQLPRPVLPQSWPLISICIVIYNSEPFLKGLFHALVDIDYPVDKLELILVDNASTDATDQILESYIPSLDSWRGKEKLRLNANIGYGAGQNAAVAQASGDFLLLLNPDARPGSKSLKIAVQRALGDRSDVAAWELVQTPLPYPKYYDPVSWETGWNSHVAVLMRREAFRQVDGYDPSLFLYGQDVELSYRLRSEGWRLRILADATVHHDTTMIRPEQNYRILLADRLLRRRYGGWVARWQGRAMFARMLSHSNNEAERSAVIEAQREYNVLKKKFTPQPKRGHAFEFDGVYFSRRRTGSTVPIEEYWTETSPLVSIITRTHGIYTHLSDNLSCVRQQTYPSIEHIVVEDDSHAISQTRNLVESFAHDSDRLRYIGLKKVGRSTAGNTGAQTAQGQYLMWYDQDDLIFPDHVAHLVAALEATPDAVAAYSLAWEAITVTKSFFRRTRRLVGPVGIGFEVSEEAFEDANFIPIQSVLFERKLFEEMGGFEPSLDLHEDWELWKRYSKTGRFLSVPIVTSIYTTPGKLIPRTKRQFALRRAKIPHSIEKS